MRRLPAAAQWAVVLLPVAVAYGLLWRFVTAAPLIDDYWHIFAFALQFEKTTGLAAKLALIFTVQVGPYKLIFDHALIALDLLCTGRLHLPAMILLGNLTPLGIFVLLCKHVDRDALPGRGRELLLLPVSLLLFSLNYAETLDWAISGLQQPAVILFALASVYFLVKRESKRWAFAAACGFAVLSCATYANGMLLWPVGLVYLGLHDRRASRLLGWCAGLAVTAAVYLYHYQPSGVDTHGQWLGKAVFLAMFSGGALENMHHKPVPYISLAIGVAVLATCAHAVGTRFDRRNPFFYFSTAWVLLTGAVVANARMAMGLDLSLSSRYKIYCDLLLIFCYVYLLERWQRAEKAMPQRLMLGATVALAVVVGVGGDVAGAKFLATRKDRAETAMRQYLASPQTASPMFLVEEQLAPSEVEQESHAREEMNEARRLGIYTPPEL